MCAHWPKARIAVEDKKSSRALSGAACLSSNQFQTAIVSA